MYIMDQLKHGKSVGKLWLMAVFMGVLAAVLVAPVEADEFLINGDFEADPFDSDWSYGTANIIAAVHQGLVSDGLDATGTQAAYLTTGSGTDALYQVVASSTQWQLDMLFAAESPGAGTRSLNMTIEDAGSGKINLLLGPDGKFYVYDTFGTPAKTWFKVSDDVVSFSVDGNGDNSFDDVEDMLNVYSLRIVGNYGGATPYYDMYLSAANSSELVQIASGLTRFHVAKPTTGMGLDQIRFATGASTGDYLVDKVSLVGTFPEPRTELLNGNFEAAPFDDGWINGSSAASLHRGLSATGLDASGTQSALLQKVTGTGSDGLFQYNLDMGSRWQLDMLFASGPIASGGTRSLNFTVYSDGGSYVNILLGPDGTLSAYDINDKTWHLLSDETVSFSTDGNGDGDFEDAGDSLNVHSLRIIGNYEAETPYYNVFLSDANSDELELIASNVQYWHGVHPESGDFINQLRFATGASSGVYLVDEVSLAAFEPGILKPGDANGDTVVNAADAAMLAANWLKDSGAIWEEGDFNNDGKVNDIDAAMMAANWTQAASASVPEPSALILLAIGGLALLPAATKKASLI